ncbi:TonB-dependent receptor [Parasphingorhabdus cellanae]|uniref:TonB-dependent receptor n=1 Tax=Parasphingorhabdus cellanae TaxID=2806553 RepID=A0ABX7T9Z5_9SPHN|nr:TonB-dependent receptor [Parasphingorhabdus cellanae]QTD57452.1 TonB-dependent receptor [Parasphingorhabdus cellanae]
MSAVALAWAGSTGVAAAQEAGADPDDDDNVIIVTAQLREENLQDVPIAITALSGDDLQAAKIEDALDLQFNAPNVVLSANRNLTIRGVGSQSFGGTNDTNIGILQNGVFLQQGSTFGEFFDLERIEVLRGPQGTLFGRNTTGGAINIVTAKPKDEFGGYASIQLERFDGIRAEGAINIPIANGLSQRFAAHFLKRDGYTKNLFDGNRIDGRDQFTLRSSTRFEPTSRTTVDLTLTYFREDSNRANAVKSLCTPDPVLGCSPDSVDFDFPSNNFPIDNGLLPGIVRADTFSDNPTNLREVRIDIDPIQRNEDFLATLVINQDIGDNLRLTSVTGYRDGENSSYRDFDQGTRPNAFNPGDFTVFGAPFTVTDDGNGNGVLTYNIGNGQTITTTNYLTAQEAFGTREQFSQELRLASDFEGPFNFLIGGYYLDADGTGEVNTYLPANRTLGFLTSGNTSLAEVVSYAAFGEIYYDLTPTISLLGGLRYTKDEKQIVTASGFLALGEPFVGEEDFDAWTGRASISWQPTPENNVYLTYSRGFKSGGFNPGSTATSQTFGSEFIDSYELGSKNEFFDRRLTVNAAIFRYDYKNLIFGQIVGGLAENTNIPSSRVQGLELEAFATPVPNLRLEAALGLLDTEIRSDFMSEDASRGFAPFQLQGNTLPNAPKRTLKLAAEYTIEVGSDWTIRPRADFYSQTSFNSREFNTAADRVDGWEQFDLSLQLARQDRDLSITAFVKNVLNQDSITFFEVNSELVGSFRSAFLLDPRIFGVSLRVGFD